MVRWMLCLCFILQFSAIAFSDDAPPKSNDDSALNVDSKTFGGKQFWTDEVVFHDWRIQRNAVSRHYRLLDDQDVRRAWGKFEDCIQILEKSKQEKQFPPLKPRVVILLHGLVRSRESMEVLEKYLSPHEEFTVLNVAYASTRGKLAEHASALAKVVEHLDGVQEVSFVGHSLGNLVVRHYLSDRARGVHGARPVPRVGRIVMLAPPNHGAEMARRFQDNLLFKTVWGYSGNELAVDWPTLEKHLAIPSCEFGIIAGGKGKETGGSPLLAGDDDFVVAVEETRLAGASDFLVCPVLHSLIMNDKKVQDCTLRFLQHGYFVSEAERHAIPRQPTTHE